MLQPHHRLCLFSFVDEWICVPFGLGVMSGSLISAAVSSFVDYGTHLAEAAGLSRANVGAPCMYTGFRLSSKCQARMTETAKSLTSQIQATAYIGIRVQHINLVSQLYQAVYSITKKSPNFPFGWLGNFLSSWLLPDFRAFWVSFSLTHNPENSFILLCRQHLTHWYTIKLWRWANYNPTIFIIT